VNQLFTRTAQLSVQLSEESTNDADDERARVQRELEDIEIILADSLEGLNLLDPERVSELRQETQEESNPQPVAGPSAPTNLTTPTVQRQVIEPQSNVLAVSH
jgi:hypothetical protein